MNRPQFKYLMTISLSVVMLTFIYTGISMYDNLRHACFYDAHQHVYRIVKTACTSGIPKEQYGTPPALARVLQRDLEEVEASTRLYMKEGQRFNLEVQGAEFCEKNVMRIDAGFFNVFNLSFKKGDKHTSVARPDFLLLSEEAAARYFGEADPMGKVVAIDMGRNHKTNFVVTGIIRDVPRNTNLDFSFLISVQSLRYDAIDTDWGWNTFETFVRLKPDAQPTAFMEKLAPLYRKYYPEDKERFYAQPLSKRHRYITLADG